MTKLHRTETIAQDASPLRSELVAHLERLVPQDGYRVELGIMSMSRSSQRTEPTRGMYEPTLCVVAQGKKRMEAGAERVVYDPSTFLLTSVALPVTVQVLAASVDRPYLCVGIRIDPGIIGSLVMEAELAMAPPPSEPSLRAVDVGPVDVDLLDAVVRLVRLVDSPRTAAVLAPLVHREILFRLLIGPGGSRLRQIAPLGSPTHRVAQAVEWIRGHLREPLRVPSLARQVGMSASSLHHYFRAVTGRSPLQYQKQMRLDEARRLLHEEKLDAASAGFRVGYNDVSQFTREYRRAFGAPPRRDVVRHENSGRSGADGRDLPRRLASS